MKTVKQKWESYLAKVVPPSASHAQMIETRRAFYAGAAAMFNQVVDDIGAEPSEERALGMIEGLRQELFQFSDDVKAGKA